MEQIRYPRPYDKREVFFATGDITPRYIQSPYLLLFNKALFTDYGIEYPYQAVLDGKWTIDMMQSILKDKTKDVNSDGTLDGSDFYGLASEGMTAFAMLLGCGEKAVMVEDGNPVINLGSPAISEIVGKLTSFLGSKDYCYVDPQYRSYEEGKIFKDRRSLMVAQTATNISLFRDMEDDFGILPIPKLSEEQESYYSYSQPWGAVSVCVPVTNENLERTGMIIEAMAGASKYTSTPAMYEVTLKTKFARDDYSQQMLDIICENSTYDFAGIFNWSGIFDIVVNSVYKGEAFASKYEAVADKANAEVQKTVDAFASAGA